MDVILFATIKLNKEMTNIDKFIVILNYAVYIYINFPYYFSCEIKIILIDIVNSDFNSNFDNQSENKLS